MKREITLSLKGLHLANEEANNMETVLDGNYFYKDGLHYIMAKEINDGVSSDLRLVFDESNLKVRRAGEVVTEIVFEEGVLHETMYRTPFGALPVSVDTKEYYLNINDIEKGLIEGALKYKLFVDGNETSDATLVFEIKER